MRNRKRLRLKDFDYSREGLYFVTILTKDGINYFGKIIDGVMKLNDYGRIAETLWKGITKLHKNIMLDQFVIMPNHVHGIIIITDGIVRNASTEKTLVTQIIQPNRKNSNTENIPKMHSLQNQPLRSKMLLSKIIQAFKKEVSLKINNLNKKNGKKIKLWHTSFYDHIIRSEKDMGNIQSYIYYNPLKWEIDNENLEKQ